jgi:hypothetical protein
MPISTQSSAEAKSGVVPTLTLNSLAAPFIKTPATFLVVSRVILITVWLEKFGVGALVGKGVGDRVGFLVGVGVGTSVGILLGEGVGDGELQSHMLSRQAHEKPRRPQSESR